MFPDNIKKCHVFREAYVYALHFKKGVVYCYRLEMVLDT